MRPCRSSASARRSRRSGGKYGSHGGTVPVGGEVVVVVASWRAITRTSPRSCYPRVTTQVRTKPSRSASQPRVRRRREPLARCPPREAPRPLQEGEEAARAGDEHDGHLPRPRDEPGSRKALRPHADSFPEHRRHPPQKSILDPFKPYLAQRWREGCRTAMQLWREIKEQGYPGAPGRVPRWARDRREEPAPTAPGRGTCARCRKRFRGSRQRRPLAPCPPAGRRG